MSRFRLATSLLLAGALWFPYARVATAQRAPTGEPVRTPEAEDRPAPIPAEKVSNTDHELLLNGKTIGYTATAGTLLIDGDDEKPYA